MSFTGPPATGEQKVPGGAATALSWASRAAAALADQGLFAVANFLLNVLLARWLVPDDYGAFTVVFSVFLLLGTGHGALLTEPLMVYGPGRFGRQFAGYLKTVLRGNVGLSLVASLVMLAIAVAGPPLGLSPLVGQAFVGLAAAGPFILFQWLLRRACYVEGGVSNAAWAGVLYLVLLVPGASALREAGLLTPAVAFGLMGVASLLSGLWLGWRLRLTRAIELEPGRPVAALHWRYGRWALASGVLRWVPTNLLLLLLPLYAGLAGSAELKAALYLVMPFWQATAALSAVLLPSLVRVRGTTAFAHRAKLAMVLFVASGAAYWLILVLAGAPVTALLYGGRYAFDQGLLALIGLLAVTSGASAVLSASLRARERPELVFLSHVAAVAVTVSAGIALTATLGVVGVAISIVVASLLEVAVLGLFTRKTGPGGPP